MLRYTILLCVLCSTTGFRFKRPDPKCDFNDLKCSVQIVKAAIESSAPGIEEIGVAPLDPLYQELIEKDLPDVKFFLTNSTAIGYKNTIVNELIKITDKKSEKAYRYDMTLPHYRMSGNFNLKGKLGNMVVDGDGKYDYNATNVHKVVDTLEEFYEKEGKKYLNLTITGAKAEILGSAHITYFNGGTNTLPDAVFKFLNENPTLLANLLKDTINMANLKKIFDNFNKILATVTADELFTGN